MNSMSRSGTPWRYASAMPSPVTVPPLVLTIGPMIASLYYSFTEYDILTPPRWIALENYTRLFGDPIFWQSLKVTLQFALLALPLHLIIGYLLAVLLNQKVPGLNLWRTLYYLPSVISGVAVAVLGKNRRILAKVLSS